MINQWEDLGVTGQETSEQIDQIIQEKIGIDFAAMKAALQLALEQRAEEIAQNYIVMVPNGDYFNSLEDHDEMAKFLREKATKPEHWKITQFGLSKDAKKPKMLDFVFANTAVDEGDSLVGYVFVSFAGVIRHTFVQGTP